MSEKTLSELFTEHLAGFSNTEGRARFLRHKTTDAIQRLKGDQRILTRSKDHAEMVEYDITLLHHLGETLDTVEREQWRQREAIKLYLHGRLTLEELRRISETWNGETS
jgi:hypothetical protein